MSVSSRLEFLARLKHRYQESSKAQKGRILDEFVEASGYCRKHAIAMLRRRGDPVRKPGSGRPRLYDQAVVDALEQVWQAMDCVCSKRLVPFLAEMVRVLEREDHLTLEPSVRERLLRISASTADRLLADLRAPRGISTTTPGRLLKKQVAIRTHNDWNDDRPGFFEVDLVAHCGDRASGSFLYTLVLTDIATGWTELCALPCRSAEAVLFGIMRVRSSLPFAMLGLDTDNGSEFINEGMVRYCRRERIAFTRSRPYKKNDQAHVEERNGSIVRRLVGYDRFEGCDALRALSALYEAHRLYLNCFQPMLKLQNKQRVGSRVTKRYQVAKTPFERLRASSQLRGKSRTALLDLYERLDPVQLLAQLRRLQEEFFGHAWDAHREPDEAIGAEAMAAVLQELPRAPKYRRTQRPRRRSNPFDDVWDQVEARLAQDPFASTASLLAYLQREHPGRFDQANHSTLHRKVRVWRAQQGIAGRCTTVSSALYPARSDRQWQAFTPVWDQIKSLLAQNPYLSARRLLTALQERNPGRFDDGQLYSLRRLVSSWRAQSTAYVQTKGPDP